MDALPGIILLKRELHSASVRATAAEARIIRFGFQQHWQKPKSKRLVKAIRCELRAAASAIRFSRVQPGSARRARCAFRPTPQILGAACSAADSDKKNNARERNARRARERESAVRRHPGLPESSPRWTCRLRA